MIELLHCSLTWFCSVNSQIKVRPHNSQVRWFESVRFVYNSNSSCFNVLSCPDWLHNDFKLIIKIQVRVWAVKVSDHSFCQSINQSVNQSINNRLIEDIRSWQEMQLRLQKINRSHCSMQEETVSTRLPSQKSVNCQIRFFSLMYGCRWLKDDNMLTVINSSLFHHMGCETSSQHQILI